MVVIHATDHDQIGSTRLLDQERRGPTDRGTPFSLVSPFGSILEEALRLGHMADSSLEFLLDEPILETAIFG